MAYDFHFEIEPPIDRAEFEAWLTEEGIAEEGHLIARIGEGPEVHFNGSYGGSGAYIDTFFPRFRAWLDRTAREVAYVGGDVCPIPFLDVNQDPDREAPDWSG